MEPTKACRVLTVINSIIAFAVVFKGPGLFPKAFVIHSQHPTFTARSHDLVLTEGKGSDISKRTYRPSLIGCSMSLSTVFDNFQTMFSGQFHNRVHIARPACKVNSNDSLGF